jgi:hypothetical protein
MVNYAPMQFNSRSGLLLLFLLCLSSLWGCLDDPITGPEIDPRNLFRPSNLTFRFLEYREATNTGDLRVMWSPSSNDTQRNFKGYYIKLSTADTVEGSSPTIVEPGDSLAVKRVPKSDTTVVFEDLQIDRPYFVQIWSEGNVKHPDSLKLSDNAVERNLHFDPRPVPNPELLGAVSTGRQQIRLVWRKLRQPNLSGYVVYYSDPAYVQDTGISAGITFDTFMTVTVPAHQDAQATGFIEKEYKFWVKSLRADNSESSLDSSVIRWSGADVLNHDSVALTKALFIGNDNLVYRSREVDPSVGYILFTQSAEDLVLSGLKGTKFSSRVDTASAIDARVYRSPFTDAEFNQDNLSIPITASTTGVMVYGRLGDNVDTRFRIFLHADSTGLVTASNKVKLQVVSQRQRLLPYF